MTRAIGLMLTIAGAILMVWFVQQLVAPGPTPLAGFVVAAISVAMLSVGLRYTFRKPVKRTTKTGK